VSEQLAPAGDRLLEALAGSARGPRRNGLFALWMLLRVCDGLLPPDGLSPRAQRRRLQALERRLSSLSLPAPLRRALASGLRELGEGGAGAAGLALNRLVTPVRETLGHEAAEIIGAAGHAARDAAHEHTGSH
jgi:hypothetical protein